MSNCLQFAIANELAEIRRACLLAQSFLDNCKIEAIAAYSTQLVLEEALSNVIRHGFADDRKHEILICINVGAEEIEITIVDDGREFDPGLAPAVDTHESIEKRKVGGLGIHLMRSMATDMRYQRIDNKNNLSLRIAFA